MISVPIFTEPDEGNDVLSASAMVVAVALISDESVLVTPVNVSARYPQKLR